MNISSGTTTVAQSSKKLEKTARVVDGHAMRTNEKHIVSSHMREKKKRTAKPTV